MNSIADRLRGIVRPATAQGVGGSKQRDGSVEQDPSQGSSQSGRSHMDPAAILDGEWTQAGPHRFLVVDRSYAPGHRHGSVSIADSLPPEEGWSRLGLLAGTSCGGKLLFVDLETTGIAGGAGSYAFLVDAAGSIAAVFTCGSICCRASRQSVLYSKRSEMWPATSMPSSPITASRSIFRSSRLATR